MNNKTTTISFSIYSKKGVYALLLGSGISKTSGIPTGWDIVIDLIKKIALLNNEDCFPYPEKWFIKKFNEEPNYSNLLEKLAISPSERVNLLKPYFEPNEQEREQNLKQTTNAHKVIAKLVRDGYIKVILTTNFDRLLESALILEGIEPTVIRHPNDIDGVMPLVHNDFTLIKINGDYLDSRFLNTKKELAKYDEKLYQYLLSIINDYGIISCGWSAKWDFGLINIIRKCKNFRFSSYWTYVGKCEDELKELCIHRKGELLQIENADSFFNDIYEKIKTLESINDNHPLNADIALTRLKKYILNEENKILLFDLLFNQREQTLKNIKQILDFSQQPNSHYIISILTKYESHLNILLLLVINGVYWCKEFSHQYFIDILSRIAEPPVTIQKAYFQETKDYYYYPAMLILYSIGITSIKTGKYDLLSNCFNLKIAENDTEYSEYISILEKVNPNGIKKEIMNIVISKKFFTPVSTYINQTLRPYFNSIITSDKEFNGIFDVFEYFLSLHYMYLIDKYGREWAPWGEFQWRKEGLIRNKTIFFNDFFNEAEIKKEEWLPIKMGMFKGKYSIYKETKTKLDAFLVGVHLH